MQCLNIVALVYQTHFMELSNAEMNTSQIANSLYKKNLKEEKKMTEEKRSQWDSNPRPLDPESNAISTPLCDRVYSYDSPFSI